MAGFAVRQWPRRVGSCVAVDEQPSWSVAVHPVFYLLLLTMASETVDPPTSATFQIPRQTVDGGAATARSASFELTGAIGQPDAGAPANGGDFTVTGGFHRAARPDLLLRDGFESP